MVEFNKYMYMNYQMDAVDVIKQKIVSIDDIEDISAYINEKFGVVDNSFRKDYDSLEKSIEIINSDNSIEVSFYNKNLLYFSKEYCIFDED